MNQNIGPHEGIEYELMCQGKKTVALFELVPDAFIENTNQLELNRMCVDAYTHIFYLSGYKDQADKLVELLSIAKNRGCVAEIEHEIGAILGYTKAQVDAYIEHVTHSRWDIE